MRTSDPDATTTINNDNETIARLVEAEALLDEIADSLWSECRKLDYEHDLRMAEIVEYTLEGADDAVESTKIDASFNRRIFARIEGIRRLFGHRHRAYKRRWSPPVIQAPDWESQALAGK